MQVSFIGTNFMPKYGWNLSKVQFLDKQIKESKETLNNFITLAMYLENITLEKSISYLCHQISSDKKKINQINFIYNFLKQEDSYQLPSLVP